jgi:hypothetical protein
MGQPISPTSVVLAVMSVGRVKGDWFIGWLGY